nr:hypothetical protein Iba_chr10dCG9920 [Ipomoea batatas]
MATFTSVDHRYLIEQGGFLEYWDKAYLKNLNCRQWLFSGGIKDLDYESYKEDTDIENELQFYEVLNVSAKSRRKLKGEEQNPAQGGQTNESFAFNDIVTLPRIRTNHHQKQTSDHQASFGAIAQSNQQRQYIPPHRGGYSSRGGRCRNTHSSIVKKFLGMVSFLFARFLEKLGKTLESDVVLNIDLFVDGSFTVVDELLAAKRSLRASRHHTELLLHFLKRLENNAGQRLVVRALGSTNHERNSIFGLGRKTSLNDLSILCTCFYDCRICFFTAKLGCGGSRGSISVTVPRNHFRFIDSVICLASFAVAALISDRSSPTRFFISETLRCDFSEAKSGIGGMDCFLFLVRRCGDDIARTSSALELSADLLRELLLKIANTTASTSTLLENFTDLLRL